MDLDTVGAALRRKLGPLPVWAWALIGGVVLYFLRARGYLGGLGAANQGEALQPSQKSATVPREVTTLQPGESAYDPNSGTLTTAPGGLGSASGGVGDAGGGIGSGAVGFDPAQAIEDLAAAIMLGHTDSEKPNSTTPRTHKRTALDRAKAAVPSGKIGPKNKARLVKAGYSASQISYHLRRHTALGKPRKEQPKTAHAQKPTSSTKSHTTTSKPGVHAPTPAHAKTITRSGPTTRHSTGGRETPRAKAGTSPTVRSRAATGTAQSTTRQRPRTPVVTRAAPVQHPVSAAHQTATQKHTAAQAAKPASRPANNPAARTSRPVAAGKTTPKPKPRGK